MTVQVSEESVALNKTSAGRATILRRLGSVRISYGPMVAFSCWFAFVSIVYVLSLIGVLDAR